MTRLAAWPFVSAALLSLSGAPAAADMVIAVTNQARVQVGVAVSGSNFMRHLIPGEPEYQFPATEESRTVEIWLDATRLVCSGQAVVTGATFASFCQWIDGTATSGLPAKCLAASTGNSTRQCRISILVTPTD